MKSTLLRPFLLLACATAPCLFAESKSVPSAAQPINLATGEITYGPAACVDMQIVKEAVENAGYKLEEE